MQNNEQDIEQLFSDTFKDAEILPSEDIWSRLESNLNNKNVEGVYQAAFQNASVEPSASIWKKISTALAWRSFLTFKFNTFNVYYASILSAILGVSAFQFLRSNNENKTELKQKESVVVETDKNQSSIFNDSEQMVAEDFASDESLRDEQFASTDSQISQKYNENSSQQEFSNSAEDFYSKDPKDSQKKKGKESEIATVDWSHVKITGNKSVCENIVSIYNLEGLTVHADVKWNLPKSAKKNSAAGHNISIIWQGSGEQTITAIARVDKQEKVFSYTVKVEAVAIPTIKGKAKVCQGSEKQLYYVDETINKEISYLWESQQNPIDQIGNKYINVDWTKSGKDTLFVTKVNNITGCKSQASLPIVIYPQPKIDFEVYPMGESEYEFAFTESQRKGYTYEWNIEGLEYNDPIVQHTASGSGSSFVVLTVTDKNKCVSTIQKEIDFNKNFIVVPSKFTPGSGKYFMPLTNSDLQSYRLEIYNARNEKIWETTELSNGKPVSGWDGKYRGATLPRGKYMWKISAIFDDGTKWNGVTQPNGSCRPSGIFILEE